MSCVLLQAYQRGLVVVLSSYPVCNGPWISDHKARNDTVQKV